MKQTQLPVFLLTSDEVHGLLLGFGVGITPTNGMERFTLLLDASPAPTNGRPAESDKGYIEHRRSQGKGKGRFECTVCAATFKTLARVFKHQKKAHATA